MGLGEWFRNASDRDIKGVGATTIATIAFVVWATFTYLQDHTRQNCEKDCATDVSAIRK